MPAGVPPAFHANYGAAQSFLGLLEAECRTRAAVDKFRSSAAYGAFAKRWNTSVYFSLIYQEIAGGVGSGWGDGTVWGLAGVSVG